MSELILGKDKGGAVDYSMPPMENGQGVVLAANTAVTFTAPKGYNRAYFSYSPGASVFVAINSTAASYTGTVGATNSELNPAARQLDLRGGQTISIISPAIAYVGIRFDRGT
jgi:hypothetical protein